MKCLCCNTKMVSVNDYHSCGYPMTIYACPKCESGAEVVTDDDGFITTCIFNKYKKFNDFELKMLKQKKQNRYGNREKEKQWTKENL